MREFDDALVDMLLREIEGGNRPPDVSKAVLEKMPQPGGRKRLRFWQFCAGAAAALLVITVATLIYAPSSRASWEWQGVLPIANTDLHLAREKAEVRIGEEMVLSMEEGSRFSLKEQDASRELFLAHGSVLCRAANRERAFSVRTEMGTAVGRGSTFAVRILEKDEQNPTRRMVVNVFDGTVRVDGDSVSPNEIQPWESMVVKDHRTTPYARLTIDNENEKVLTRYAVRVVVPRVEGMTTDYRDLTFVDPQGERQPHWVQEIDADQAVVWVRIARLPPGETVLAAHYGNHTVETTRSGASFFRPAGDGNDGLDTRDLLLFDDFEDGFNPQKWFRNRDASNGGCGAYVRDGQLHVRAGDDNGVGFAQSLVDLPPRVSIMARIKVERKNDYARGGLYLLPPANVEKSMAEHRGRHGMAGIVGIEYNHYTYGGTPTLNSRCFTPVPMARGVALKGYWQNRWFFQVLRYDGSRERENFTYLRDDGETCESLTTTMSPCEKPLRINIQPWAWYATPNHRFTIDWIAVRELPESEPVVQLTLNEGVTAVGQSAGGEVF